MALVTERAKQMYDELIVGFARLRDNASPDSCYGPEYDRLYVHAEALIENTFSRSEAMIFRSDLTTGAAILYGSAHDDVTYYRTHITRLINRLEVYKERLGWEEKRNAPGNDPLRLPLEKRGVIKASDGANGVFVVHGHDIAMKESVARVLSQLELDPIVLHERANRGRTIIEKFEDYATSRFAVVLLSADDMGYSVLDEASNPRPRARQNVILELGFFLGKLGRQSVLPLVRESDRFEFPSDYDGIIYTPFDDRGEWKLILVRELRTCGYQIDANRLC